MTGENPSIESQERGAEVWRCETCVFWGGEFKDDFENPVGSCRLAPPSITTAITVDYQQGRGTRVLKGQWPYTLNEDWCGQWQER